ncbi:UNVERIFIED_CONTAM: hypothetical protein GTU68_035257 [Idotea baltica]|nr:hypothetical protein [Idotea baltica]
MAVNSLGAIWSCCSPDFGSETIFERFSQIEPVLLIAVDGYWYNRKSYSILSTSKHLKSQIPSIRETILIPYLDKDAIAKDTHRLQESDEISEIHFESVPFSHPIWVLYSSGTTGKPKAITHSHGGVLLEHLKYLSLHNDVKVGENFFWFSTTGWMMWNFLQASLLVGATPVLYDGSPANPDLHILWKLAEQLPIHHFGTSAPYLTTLMKHGLIPGKEHNLSNLRTVGSTGSPLPPEIFHWVYEAIGEEIWLCSMSGGTDVCTAFVGGCIEKPVYEGRIQGRSLGCALSAYTDEGLPIKNELGEMVIDQPMPSMPINFWNDPGDERYLASYFQYFPGKWRHGDWIKIFEDGSLVIQGRSDATLNRKGIRIGTAEIYNAMDQLDEVKDCLIINIEKPNGNDVMPLFVSLPSLQVLSEELKAKINDFLKSKCSPRHVPDTIIQVSDIPYTLSGKKMEVPVKRLFTKHISSKPMDYGAMRNPEAMKEFAALSEDIDI